MLKLSFGLDFADLHQRDGLARLDEQFLHFIAASDPALRARLGDAYVLSEDPHKALKAYRAALRADRLARFLEARFATAGRRPRL